MLAQLFAIFIISTPTQMSHEFSPGVYFSTGDAMRSTTLAGASYTYHLNEEFWVGAEFMAGRLSIDTPNGIGIRDRKKFAGLAGLFSWNIPSLIGATRTDSKSGYAADLYTSLGIGNLWVDKKTEIYGILGGGLLFHFPAEHFGIRFDLKGLFFNLDNSSGNSFNFDSVLSIGPSFLF